jgi:adenylate cyclase
MRAGAKSFASWALPLAILAVALAVIVLDIGGAASRLAGLQFDIYQRVKPRDENLALISSPYKARALVIDSAVTARLGSWPWPDDTLKKVTDALKKAGAPVIAFAMPLSESAPDSPQRFAEELPQTPDFDAARTALEKMTTADESLADAFSGIKIVTGFTARNDAGDDLAPVKAPITVQGIQYPFSYVPQYRYAVRSLPLIETASAGEGALNLPVDRDGVVRSVPLVLNIGGKIVPSLAAEAMRVLGKDRLSIYGAESSVPLLDPKPRIASLSAGSLTAMTRRDGALVLYFTRDASGRQIAASSLLGTALPDLKNTVVIVAPPGDKVHTPAGLRSIADVQAEALENVFTGTALNQSAGFLPQLVFLAVAGAVLVFLLLRTSSLWAGVWTILAIAGAQSFGWFLFANTRVLLDCTTPSAALVLAWLGGFAARMSAVANARAILRQSFADTLPQSVIDRISRDPSSLKLGGETRTVTCLSCGVRRYNELAQTFKDNAPDFTRMISTLMGPLLEAALDCGGTIGHLSGDRFIAYWNAPLDDPDHAVHACDAAQKMTLALATVNEQLGHERRFDGTAFEPVEIGVGVSTGPAICSGFTARGRTTYSVTGECTNLAEATRILSAQYGPAIVVSEETRKAAERHYAFLEVDYLQTTARPEPAKLFAILGNPVMRASPKFRALDTFHQHIFEAMRAREWGKARELIEQCRKLSGASQKLYDLQLKRIDEFEAHPPAEDWDGAYRLAAK